MGYILDSALADDFFTTLSENYTIYAPKKFPGQGRFSDTDLIRYDKVSIPSEIEFLKKSDFPAKEVLAPIHQTLFYFTEDEYKESKVPVKPILIFSRPCDINAIKIQLPIFEGNGGFKDLYYSRLKNIVKFVLIECNGGEDTCFCASMGANKTDDWSFAIRKCCDNYLLNIKDEEFVLYLKNKIYADFEPVFVEENETKVTVPEIPDKETLNALKTHPFWKEFDGRCISCGACTAACSTCTCFTARDIIYSDNPEVGERRRVSASCQVEGFDKMAGQKEFRSTAGERMRYKVLHKFHDYKARFGERHMCVGCGRCTDRCPAMISITATVQKMTDALNEIKTKRTHRRLLK